MLVLPMIAAIQATPIESALAKTNNIGIIIVAAVILISVPADIMLLVHELYDLIVEAAGPLDPGALVLIVHILLFALIAEQAPNQGQFMFAWITNA